MKRSLYFLVVAITIAFALSINSFAQGTTSRVTGTVTDANGEAVAGASVTLTNPGTNISLATQTSDSGAYVFDLVQPGTYTVTVEKQGFKKFVSTNNIALINQPATVNVKLEIGGIQEVVQVEATAEAVQTSSSGNIGGTVEQRTLESLPIVGLRGRNPLDLLNYQPGFVVGANTGGGNHVHGSRDRAFNFTLDGVDINESSAGGSNFTPLRPNPDSIQEFQFVSANATAELGRNSGAQVTMVTRPGTNRFRGTAFEYYQTPDVNATEYQNNLNGLAKDQFVQHIFGGSYSGPIVKNKMFFFGNLQMLRAYETRLVTRTVYTQSARQGIFRYVLQGQNAPVGGTLPAAVDTAGNPVFAPCPNPVPVPAPSTLRCIQTYNMVGPGSGGGGGNTTGVGFDTTLTAFLNAMPLPNNFSVGDGLNTAGFNFAAPQREKQYDATIRLDYKFSETNHLYGRWAQGKQDTLCDSVNGGLQAFPDTPCKVDTQRNPKNLAVNWRWSPKSNLTNEFVFGLNKFAFNFENPSPNDSYPYIFNLVTDPFDNFTYNARKLRTFQFVDNVTWVTGNHLLKAGLNFRFGRQIDDRSSVSGADITPRITFSAGTNSNFTAFNLPGTTCPTTGPPNSNCGLNATDATRLRSTINDFLGRVGAISRAFVVDPSNLNQFAAPGTRWAYTHYYPEYDFYVQDTWKLRPNLTFDIGARYEVRLAPSSKDLPVLRPDGQISIATPPTTSLKWVEGKLFEDDYDNISPSVGLAWDPFKDGKTSFRANFRVAYDRLPSQLFANSIFQSAPGNNFGVINTAYGQGGGLLRGTLPTIAPSSTPDVLRTPPAFSANSITVIDSDFQYPETYSWFFGFQREFWKHNVFEINYIRKRGVHLFGGYDANQVSLNSRDSRCSETFLEAFNLVRAATTNNSCLINLLYTGSTTNNAGTATFRSTVGTAAISQGSVAAAAASIASRTCQSADVTSGLCTAVGQQLISRTVGNPFFFQRFPQFAGAVNVLDSNDISLYNGLEFIVRRRIQDGLGMQFSYTLSRSRDTRSFDPTFTVVSRGNVQSASSTPFDVNNRRRNYAWSDFDRRHAWQGALTYELPFGKGRMFASDVPKALDWIVGGWQLSGLMNITSGRPFTVYSGVNTLSNAVQSTANCGGCARDLGVLIQENGTNYWFAAQDRALFSAPAPGSGGETGRNYFIGPRRFEMDASMTKKFTFSERYSFDLRVDAKNIFNVAHFGFPTAVIPPSGTTFGQIRGTVNSNARRIQLSGKLNF